MLQCINCINSFSPVKLQELSQQRKSKGRQFAKHATERRLSRFEFCNAIAARKLSPTWHCLVRGRTNEVKDDLSLVEVCIAGQNGLFLEDLAKNTTNTPHVDCGCVLAQLQKKFWWSIPTGDNQSGVLSRSLAASVTRPWWVVVIWACKAKVGNLQNASVIDEEICSLHVSM